MFTAKGIYIITITTRKQMQIKWKIGNDLTQNIKQKNRNCATQTSIEFTPMHRENFCCIAKITNVGK